VVRETRRGVYIPRYIQGMYGHRSTRTAETPYGASPTGSPPLSGYARLAWFPDGYRVSIFPYRSALRPNPASRAHRPRYSAFPTAVGALLALEGPTLRVTTAKASNLSALWEGKPPRHTELALRGSIISAYVGQQVARRTPSEGLRAH
jgi:hypothetical protein